MSSRIMITAFAAIIALAATAGGLYWWHGHAAAQTASAATAYKTPQESNPYVRFDMEGYDTIEANYWQTATDTQMSLLFQLSLAKAVGTSTEPLSSPTRAGVAEMLSDAFANLSTTTQEQLAVQTLTVALYNLAPTGRDNLLSSQAQTALKNTVDNVNPSENLYQNLGIESGASTQQVDQAYATQHSALAATTSATGKAALAAVDHAHQVLSNPTDKTIYDQTGALPTVFSHMLNAHTLYIDISSVAPTTIAEFSAALDAASSTPNLTNLIIDLRGNIGGDLTFTQNFLALFFGSNQYAFDLFHQGNLEVQRTTNIAQSSSVTRFKQIAVLTDDMTQSTAELTASALKHDHLAYVVGTTTRGWGSVEQIIPMQTVIDPNETYALELVEYLTVRYDGLPIEGNGVVPDVNVADTNWKNELSNYFTSADIIAALKGEATKAPLQ